MRLLNRRNMRINLAKRTARKRYLVYTTDDFGKPAVDPTRVFASPQPQNRHFRGPVEKVGLTFSSSNDMPGSQSGASISRRNTRSGNGRWEYRDGATNSYRKLSG